MIVSNYWREVCYLTHWSFIPYFWTEVLVYVGFINCWLQPSVIDDKIIPGSGKGMPEIINSDPGRLFTSQEYTEILSNKECRSAWMVKAGQLIISLLSVWKSVKYECTYLYAFEDGLQLNNGLDIYFIFYNTERFHQSLDYETPESNYKKTALAVNK